MVNKKIETYLIGILILISASYYTVYAQEEFCFRDVFQPRCHTNEVILIEEASLGRKKMGRCLSDEGTPGDNFLKDPQFLGCYVNVKSILDLHCSGKQQCDVAVAKIDAETNCHKWNKLYLEVTYNCLKLISENHQCLANAADETQHILKQPASPITSCGSKNHPWSVESLPGQRIHFTLIPLSNDSALEKMYFNSGRNDKACKVLGYLIDKSSKQKIAICYGKMNGLKQSFIESSTNAVGIEFESSEKAYNIAFLISIKATGCSDLIPPADAWLKRTENEAIIGCYSTRLRWQLKCQGQRWIGVIGNCSHGPEAGHVAVAQNKPEDKSESSVVTIVAIAMIGFVICFLIICLGVVLLNRYYAVTKSKALNRSTPFGNDPMNMNYSGQTILKAGNNKTICLPSDETKYNTNGWTRACSQDPAQYFELDQPLVQKEPSMDVL